MIITHHLKAREIGMFIGLSAMDILRRMKDDIDCMPFSKKEKAMNFCL